MFTGIIETLGTITHIQAEESNLHFTVASSLSDELKVDQSVSHNGVCLTVVHVSNGEHKVTAVQETLIKSNLASLAIGDRVNLERCTVAGGRLDGHIVQGHVDQTGICTAIEDKDGSWIYSFVYDGANDNITVEKGSIAINGISLTVFNSIANAFSVAIIPYTHEHTNMHRLNVGDQVNLEFDIIGKYVSKLLALRA